MKCHSCGYELGKEDNFCEHCGQEVQLNNESNEAAHAESASTIEENKQEPVKVDFDQYKEGLFNYWAFCLNALKSPFNHATAIVGSKQHMLYGIVTIILAAITLPLIFLSLIQTFVPWGVSADELSIVSPFFHILIFMALTIGGIFAVAKIGKSPVSFQQAIASFGFMMVIPLGMLIISLILSLLNVFFVSLMFLLLAMVAFALTIIYTVHLFLKNLKGGIDTFYGSLITFVLLMGILYVFFESSVINNLRYLEML